MTRTAIMIISLIGGLTFTACNLQPDEAGTSDEKDSVVVNEPAFDTTTTAGYSDTLISSDTLSADLTEE